MQTIFTLQDSNVIPGASNVNSDDFSQREAVRAIVINEHGQIALLWVGKNKYHKLPGGGIEASEDRFQALERELLEEIGCKAEIVSEVGQIIEFRNKWRMKQTSYCYIANTFGGPMPPTFTQEELDGGFKVIWADGIDAAITLLAYDKPAIYEGMFIQRRDVKFLEATKPLLQR